MPQFRFSPAAIRKAHAPKTGRTAYYDEGCNGLVLRVSASGERALYSKLWQATSKRYAWDRICNAKNISAPLLKNAQDRVIELRGLMAKGADLAADRAQAREQPTLEELVKGYLAERTRRGDRSVETDREQLYQRWLGKLPDAPPRKHGQARTKPPAAVDWSERRAGSISTDDITALVLAIGQERRIAGRVHEFLHAAFEWACLNKRATGISVNPAHRVKAPSSRRRKRFARSDELPALLAEIERAEQPWRDLFTVLLYVGFRRGAVQSMRWQDVDFTGKRWHVPEHASKNKEPVILPLQGPALDVLKRRAKAKESPTWVFPGKTKTGHVGRPKRAWNALLQRAGLKDHLRPHDLRRTLGSHLAGQGASLPIIAKTLGHRDIQSAVIYTQLEEAPQQRALAAAHEVFQQAAKRKRRGP